MKIALRAALYTICGTLLLLVAGLASLRLGGHQLLAVQTASMLPTIRPGDAIVVEPVRASQLHIGDIISYRSPQNPHTVITHRLVARNAQTQQLITSGDANTRPDPPVAPSHLIGRATVRAPQMGRLLDALRHPLGLVCLVYVPGLCIIVAEVRRLAQTYARPSYSVRL